MHSHLLPGIDDGVKSWEESLIILESLQQIGIKKVITTPHIMSGYYENTPDIINSKLEELNILIGQTENLNITVEAAAEYYVDEFFLKYIDGDNQILSFGENFILIETSFLNKPQLLSEAIFLLQTKGYQPVLAHPERYLYIQENYDVIEEVLNTNTLLQVNINSFLGYYSPAARKLAEHLVKNNQISFLGSDIHNQKHLNMLKKTINKKYFQQCRQLNLMNNSL